MIVKECLICKQEFEARAKNVMVCKDPNCKKAYSKICYSQRLTNCICQQCGKFFKATDKQRHDLCPDCYKAIPYKYKNSYIQKHYCKYCNKLVCEEHKVLTRQPVEEIYDKVCDGCKRQNYLNSSIRMKLNNANQKAERFNTIEEAEAAKQLRQAGKRKYETAEQRKKAASNRMKLANPMKNPEIAAKMAETLKLKYQFGGLQRDGRSRSNYKGTRGVKSYIRIALKGWTKSNLARANYTCEVCGERGEYLHVHHLEKFSDLVEYFAALYNLDLAEIVYKSDDYNKLEKAIIEYHLNNDIGIVVCEKCHDKLDPCFHKQKQ